MERLTSEVPKHEGSYIEEDQKGWTTEEVDKRGSQKLEKLH